MISLACRTPHPHCLHILHPPTRQEPPHSATLPPNSNRPENKRNTWQSTLAQALGDILAVLRQRAQELWRRQDLDEAFAPRRPKATGESDETGVTRPGQSPWGPCVVHVSENCSETGRGRGHKQHTGLVFRPHQYDLI